MRRLLGSLLALGLLVGGMTACSRSGGEAQVDQVTPTAPSGTEPGLVTTDGTRPPATAPVGASTTTPVPKPTTLPVTRLPRTTTTRPPRTTTTRPPRTTTTKVLNPVDAQFCGYIRVVTAPTDTALPFPEAFAKLFDAVEGAMGIAPPAVADSLVEINAVLLAMRPSVEDGTITSTQDAAAWLLSQPDDLWGRFDRGITTLKDYTKVTCP